MDNKKKNGMRSRYDEDMDWLDDDDDYLDDGGLIGSLLFGDKKKKEKRRDPEPERKADKRPEKKPEKKTQKNISRPVKPEENYDEYYHEDSRARRVKSPGKAETDRTACSRQSCGQRSGEEDTGHCTEDTEQSEYRAETFKSCPETTQEYTEHRKLICGQSAQRS